MVLLSGAAGFLGSFVLNELVKQGFEVVALFRTKRPVMKKYPAVTWIQVDLSKKNSLVKLPIPSEGIIHLASTLSLEPAIVMNVDIPVIGNLLKKWEKGPFIFVSSTDIYGPLQVVPAVEDHPLNPVHWYGLGKLIGEQQLQMAAGHRNRNDFVIFRPPYILGPHKDFYLSPIGRLIDRARLGKQFILPEKWQSHKIKVGHSWVNAYDLAGLIVGSLYNGLSGTYNVVSGFVTWKKLIEQILVLSASPGRIVFKGDGDKTLALCDEERCFSNKKLTSDYPFQCTSLRKTLIKVMPEFTGSVGRIA